MSAPLQSRRGFLSSTVGKKYLLAITGLIWSLFVMQHMLGNLLILVSAEMYNSYAHAIVSNPLILYGGESVLLLSMLAHMALAISLTMDNKAARGSQYYATTNGEKGVTLASKTMIFSGALIGAFLVYHLITFKYGPYYTVTYDGVEMRDMHKLVIEVFQSPAYVLGYIFCLLVLALHLSHGVSSVFKSWGFNHPKYTPCLEKFGYLYAFIVAAGFIAQPLYAMMQR